jgi:hypothetical protein
MPTLLPQWQTRCAVIDDRSSPDCSVHESDDEDNDADILMNLADIAMNSFSATEEETTEIAEI